MLCEETADVYERRDSAHANPQLFVVQSIVNGISIMLFVLIMIICISFPSSSVNKYFFVHSLRIRYQRLFPYILA